MYLKIGSHDFKNSFFILGSYKFLAYLECIRSYAWSFGHSDPSKQCDTNIAHYFIDKPVFKGQIISKGLLVSSNSPKKQTNKFVFITTTNSFVCFLGEFEDTKKSFRNCLTFTYLHNLTSSFLKFRQKFSMVLLIRAFLINPY